MITTEGKARVKRYLAGQGGTIANSIAVGVSAAAEAVGDARLGFEVERFDVDLIAYDFVANQLIFKGVLPAEFAGRVYEIGLWSTEVDYVAGDSGSRVLTSFDTPTEAWTNETAESAIARIGTDSLKHTPAASGSLSSVLDEVDIDLSGYSGTDFFSFAVNVENAFTSSIRYRFMTDASNYYDFTFTTPVNTAGYKLLTANKSAAVATGVPLWDDISSIQVTTNSTAGGASAVEYDGIRIEDVDTVNPDYVLVARKVLATPVVKLEGRALEFEYALNVTV